MPLVTRLVAVSITFVLSVLDIDELFHSCSWCAANRDGFEYREAVQRENLHYQYVYRIRHGHGWCFRE